MKILAVDDEPFIRELLPMLAERVGFPNVLAVASGRLALDALAESEAPFDCVLLDINMPEMDGIELCSLIREIAGYERTPIIMLTAMSERQFMDAAFKAGATDYVTKPFDLDEFGARLRSAEELVTARRQVQTVMDARPGTTQVDRFAVSEALAIDGVNGLIDFHSLKNYLKQSSRAGLAASQMVAVKIDGIEQIYDRATTEEFIDALHEVAHAINEAVQTRGSLTSYAGSGIFVVVSNNLTPLSSSEIEADVQYRLDENNAVYESGTPMDIEVSIGEPVSPNFGDVADVPASVERAIARAEERSVARRDTPRSVNIRLFVSRD